MAGKKKTSKKSKMQLPGKGLAVRAGARMPEGGADLRMRAEEMLLKQFGTVDKIPSADVKRIVHELQVHQIELEMQNDELRRIQQELEAAREKYFDLYDLAPAGYVSLNEKGIILEANLTAATLLGVERNNLVGHQLFSFIYIEDQDLYYLCSKRLVKTYANQACEMRLVGKDGAPFWVRIDFSAVHGIDDTTGSRAIIIDISERKRAEEALQESGEQFCTLANSIPNLAWWANGDGYITWYNRRWYEYTGMTPEQMEGWSWQSVLDPEVSPQVLERWKASIATGAPFDMEFSLLGADGLFRPFLTRVMPLKDYSGLVLRWFGTNTDISALKKAGDALQKSEERLRRFYEAGLIGVMYWNMDGIITDANNKFLEMVGHTRQDLVAGRIDWVNMTPPEYRHLDEQFIRELKTTGVNEKPFEKEYIRKDGTRIPIIVAGAMLDEARFNGVAFVMDIIDRKLAEEAQRESRSKLEAALSSMTDAVFISDDQGQLINFNDAFVTFYRFRNRDECAKTLAEYMDIFDVFMADGSLAPLDMWPVPRALRGETATGAEYTLRRKDTDETWVGSYSFGPIRDKNGVIVGSVVVGRDITGHKLAESELLKAKTELQSLSRNLLEMQEREKRHIARELHDELGQKLTVLKMGLQAISHTRDQSLLRSTIQDNIMIVEGMIDQVRDLSLDLRPSILDDLGLLPALRWYVSRIMQGVEFDIHLQADSLEGIRLPSEIETACFRLIQEALTNVIRHAKASNVIIELIRKANDLSLTVKDDGMGFDVVRIIEHSKRGGSFGVLGMQERAMLAGGALNIESSIGVGTMMSAYFPLSIQSESK